MYKKLNIKTLALVLVILLVIVAVVYISDAKKGERSFRARIIDADTSKITSIVIYPKGDKNNVIELNKKSDGWKVISGNKSYNADEMMINNTITTLAGLKPQQLTATRKEHWGKFDVTDSAATRVKLYEGKKLVTNLYVGRFNYQPPPRQTQNYYNYGQQGTMSTYVRLADEKEVYSVEGFLSMSLGRNANDFRKKTIINCNKDDLNKISFSYPADSSFTLMKEGDKWTTDGLVCDSTAVAAYINAVSRLTSSGFADDNILLGNNADYVLHIEGNNFATPIVIKAFRNDSTENYFITSSLNEGAIFNGSGSNLTNKLFVSRRKFLKP